LAYSHQHHPAKKLRKIKDTNPPLPRKKLLLGRRKRPRQAKKNYRPKAETKQALEENIYLPKKEKKRLRIPPLRQQREIRLFEGAKIGSGFVQGGLAKSNPFPKESSAAVKG